MDLAALARNPAWWPKWIVLTKPTSLPIVSGGIEIGKILAPSGMEFRMTQVVGVQVEVEFEGRSIRIPADSTDLRTRAAAIAAAPPPVSTPPPMLPVEAAPTPFKPAEPAPVSSRFEEHVSIDVLRNRKAANLTGFNDPRDTVSFKIKMANSDVRTAFENLTGELYVFAVGGPHHSQFKLLGTQSFPVSVPARGNFEFASKEMAIFTETTGTATESTSIYSGFKYEGWLLRVVDNTGTVVARKASTPPLRKLVDKASSLPIGQPFDRATAEGK